MSLEPHLSWGFGTETLDCPKQAFDFSVFGSIACSILLLKRVMIYVEIFLVYTLCV
jgi:hypothetical protein